MKFINIVFSMMIGAGVFAIGNPSLNAQTKSDPHVLKSIDYGRYVSDSVTYQIIPIQDKKGKWGFDCVGGSGYLSSGERYDHSKKTIIKPKYDELGEPFVYYKEKTLPVNRSNDWTKKTVYAAYATIPVKKNGKWGLVSVSYELEKPKYDEIGKPTSRAKKNASGEYEITDVLPAKLNGNQIWLSPRGGEVENPGDLEAGYIFGIPAVDDHGKLMAIHDKWAEFDISGNKRIRMRSKDGHWHRMIYPQNELAEEVTSDGWVKYKSANKDGYTKDFYAKTNEDGDVDESIGVIEVITDWSDGDDFIMIFSKNGAKGIMRNWKVLLDPEYSDIQRERGGLVVASKKGSSKIYDINKQKVILEGPYSKISFYNGSGSDYWVAAVEKNGKWGFINQTGKEIIPCQYKSLRNFDGRTLARTSDGSEALLKAWPYSGNVEVLIPAGVFDEIENLSNQPFFTLTKGKLKGAYFPSSKTYIAPKYQHLSSAISGYVLLWNGNGDPVRGVVTAYNMKGKAVLSANIQNQNQLKAFLQKLMY